MPMIGPGIPKGLEQECHPDEARAINERVAKISTDLPAARRARRKAFWQESKNMKDPERKEERGPGSPR
jgi:hypothetical protein